MNEGPLIVQSDKTLLLEVDHERAGDCRKAIAPFAELERSPEHIHTYRLTPLGLWNARAAGHDAEQVVDTLLEFSRYAVPHALLVDVDGAAHAIALHETEWSLRAYQKEAAESVWHGGSWVVVLPCGAGKTLVGAAAMAHAKATTLILVTNTVSARQWKDELVRRTSLTEEEIGEYSGSVKEVRPVTIATYQVMTTRRKVVYSHLELLDARDWGLVVYDEVHLLPAPIFRMTADLQARRRTRRARSRRRPPAGTPASPSRPRAARSRAPRRRRTRPGPRPASRA